MIKLSDDKLLSFFLLNDKVIIMTFYKVDIAALISSYPFEQHTS